MKPFPRVQRTKRLRNKAAADQVAGKAYANAIQRSNGGQVIPTLEVLIGQWNELRGAIARAAYRKSVATLARLHLYGMGTLRPNELTTDAIEGACIQHLQSHRASSASHLLRLLKC